jgi:putative transposase
MYRGLYYENITIYRQPDYGHIEAERSRTKQNEAGSSVPDLCREHGIGSASSYTWRTKFGGMDASLMMRMKELEDENRRLKKMYAEEKLMVEIAKEIIEKRCKASPPARAGKIHPN